MIARLNMYVRGKRASFDDITSYKANIDSKPESFIYDYDVIYCNDIHCNNDVHRAQMCSTQSYPFVCPPSAKTIPRARPQCKIVPGWNEKVKDALNTSQFWHWIWLEAQKPMAGHIYCIMKRTRHQIHYAVRRAKRRTTETIRTKLAGKMTNIKDFWREI